MIQRIQSIYLLAVVVINGVIPFWLALGKGPSGEALYVFDKLWYSVPFYSAAVLALLTVFLYKNRKNQFVLNRLNIIINLVVLGVFIYQSLMASGAHTVSEQGVGMLLPVAAIVFLVLANKAIKKDEDLVRSVDRLR